MIKSTGTTNHQNRSVRRSVPSYAASARAPFATANNYNTTSNGNGSCTNSSYMTSKVFEERIVHQRDSSASSSSLSSYHKQSDLLSTAAASDARVNNMRKLKRLQEQNAEYKIGYELDNASALAARVELTSQQDKHLAAAIALLNAEKSAKEEEKRRICRESEEIRSLTSSLAAARVNRDRHYQLIDKAARVEEEKNADSLCLQISEERRKAAEIADANLVEERYQLSLDRRRVLEEQIEEREKAKFAAYKAFLEEKDAINQIVASVAAEEMNKLSAKKSAQEQLRLSIAEYLAQRQKWREFQAEAARLELIKISEYAAEQERRLKAAAEQSREKTAREDAILASISADIASKEKEREEMERMLEELYSEEREMIMLKEIEEKEAKITRMRAEMKAENQTAIAYKLKREKERAAEESSARAEIALRLAAESAKDAQAAAKRKSDRFAYQTQIELMMEERREAAAERYKIEGASLAAEQAKRLAELEIIEKERERLLAELGAELKDYLPKGVIKNEKEFMTVMRKKIK